MMEAIDILDFVQGTGEHAEKITALDACQRVCQDSGGCDCRGCSDSG